MSRREFARSQLWVALGVVIFCFGSIFVYERWWAKAIFGLLAVFAVWLAVGLASVAWPLETLED